MNVSPETMINKLTGRLAKANYDCALAEAALEEVLAREAQLAADLAKMKAEHANCEIPADPE